MGGCSFCIENRLSFKFFISCSLMRKFESPRYRKTFQYDWIGNRWFSFPQFPSFSIFHRRDLIPIEYFNCNRSGEYERRRILPLRLFNLWSWPNSILCGRHICGNRRPGRRRRRIEDSTAGNWKYVSVVNNRWHLNGFLFRPLQIEGLWCRAGGRVYGIGYLIGEGSEVVQVLILILNIR